jgi:hypothetical protein
MQACGHGLAAVMNVNRHTAPAAWRNIRRNLRRLIAPEQLGYSTALEW